MEKTNSLFEQSADEAPQPEGVKCSDCDRIFKSIAAVNMHKVRAHGPGWDTSGNFGRGGRSGHKRKTREEVLQWKREYNKKYRERLRAKGLSTRDNLGMRPKRKKVQYVYPDPEQQRAEEAMNQAELDQVEVPTLKHCPACGEHLAGWKYQP